MVCHLLMGYLIYALSASLAALALAWWAGRRGPLPKGSSVGLLLFGALTSGVAVLFALLVFVRG